MNFISICYIVLFYLWNVFISVDANAMLKPSHRGTMWTRTNYNSAGYNYMGINCGGISRYKLNNGKCGLCGDPFNGPRKHESGGKYATGAIADVIDKGQRNIYVKILLNTDQGGYFEFHLCVTNGTAETQACFKKHLLKISEGRLQGDEFSYYVNRAGIIPLTVEVPDQVYCERCVLQWKYVTGNTFGRDEHGVGCLGCGHQETFVNCADITIKGWEIPTTTPPPTTPIPTTVWWTTTVAPTTPLPTTTTTTTTPAPTTRAPTTTAAKVVQITKAKVVSKNTQSSTRQRRPATDFDEGSRQRGQYARYPNAYGSGSAPSVPKKTPAVVPGSIFRSNSLGASNKKVIAAQTKSQPVVPKKVETQTVVNLPKENKIEPSHLPKRQSGPFKIPRPPQLTLEQINALNNDKNVQPGHDPLQKYVDVGSSRIVAAVDFTTVRSQQVATPPTTSKRGYSNQRSPDSMNLNNPVLNAPSPKKKSDVFNSFGSEMMGASTKSPAKPQQRYGMNLINEYGIIPSVSPKGSFASQNKNMNNNRASYTNEYASSNSRNQNPQVSRNSNLPQNNQQNNRRFPYESQQSRTYPSNSQFVEKPVASVSYVSSRYGTLQQKPEVPATVNAKQLYSPEQPRAMYIPETGMFGVSGYQAPSKNSAPNQNSFNTGSGAQYGQMPNNVNTYNQNKYQQHNLMIENPVPTKTTRLPVVDTFAHKADTNVQSPNIAPWRNQQLSQSANGNKQDVQDKPVNLFKDKDRNKFKAPVVFERFTNYQVGGSKKKPNTLPENLIKANQLRQQETLQNTAVSNDSLHLNTGLHSPEQYFGQDHYIAKDVELSNQAFGGPNSPDYQPKLSPDVGQVKATQVQGDWQSQQEIQSQGGWQPKQANPPQGGWQTPQGSQLQDNWQAQQSMQYLGGWQAQHAEPLQAAGMHPQNNWQSNAGMQQQGGWHTQENSQTFENTHLNAGLHSPTNYFPQNNGAHQSQNGYNSLWNPFANHVPSTLTTQPSTTTTTTTTQAPTTTTTTQPTTQAAPTTDIIQYQMNELKRLRERMERLQRLLLNRNRGAPTEVSTSFNPTQIPKDTNNKKEVSQVTIDVPQSFNKKEIYVNPQNTNMNNNNNIQTQRAHNKKSHQHEIRVGAQYNAMKQTSTLPPSMTKETTKYIDHLKKQMLQSIKQANRYKKQQMSPPSEKTLQNKQTDIYDTKPFNKEKMTYVTPSLNTHGQQSNSKVMTSQYQPELNNNQQQQQNTNTKKTVKEMSQEERRRKYKRILELLLERRQQKKVTEQNQVTKANTRKDQHVNHYQNDLQHNTHHVDTNYQPRQKQLAQSYNPAQSLQHKPVLAEMHINAVKKVKINQEPVISSVRPVETLHHPATEGAAVLNAYKPNVVKTTIDKLANRLAAGMAEKLSTAGKAGVGNFHVLPLSSDSVMSALRNIASKILKSQKNKNPQNVQTTGHHLDNAIAKDNQHSKKPTLKEVYIPQDVQRQQIGYVNDLTTEMNKHTPTPTAESHTITSQKKQVQTSNNDNVMSPEKSARRESLIRKMKALMRLRRQRLHMNTKTESQTIESSQVRPTESSHFGTSTGDLNHQGQTTDLHQHEYGAPTESRHQEIISNNHSFMSGNGNTMHENGIPNSEMHHGHYVDQNTEHYHAADPTLTNQEQHTSQQALVSRGQQQIAAGLSDSTSTMDYSTNNRNKAKVRMTPDIAKTMLSRVRGMLAQQNNQNGGSKNIQAMSTKDVLVMPLNKEMLFKLLQSMKKKRESTGR